MTMMDVETGGDVETSSRFALAVDAMGGDDAPGIVVDGLALAVERQPALRVLLIGDQERLTPLLARSKPVEAICTVRHASGVITNEMKGTAALRVRDSSMRLAMDAVACGEAQCVVSAGNSGPRS